MPKKPRRSLSPPKKRRRLRPLTPPSHTNSVTKECAIVIEDSDSDEEPAVVVSWQAFFVLLPFFTVSYSCAFL